MSKQKRLFKQRLEKNRRRPFLEYIDTLKEGEVSVIVNKSLRNKDIMDLKQQLCDLSSIHIHTPIGNVIDLSQISDSLFTIKKIGENLFKII